MQRPSVVYDVTSGLYFLYFDQGGICETFGPTLQAQCEQGNFTNIPSCQIPSIDNCTNQGFNIHVAYGTDGKAFYYHGLAFNDGQWRGTPEVKKFNSGWIMFYDQGATELSVAQSSDGLFFNSPRIILNNPDVMTTNVAAIQKGDRLHGVTFGTFPKLLPGERACGPGEQSASGCVYASAGFRIDKGEVRARFLQHHLIFTEIKNNQVGRIFSKNLALDEDRVVLADAVLTEEDIDAGGIVGVLEMYNLSGRKVMTRGMQLQRNTFYEIKPK